MLTIHCRTRAEGYQPEVEWTRIERAVRTVSIPVCGNGGVRSHGDLQRMRDETGCQFVMVGQGALADPWIFSGHEATRAEAAAFLIEYATRLQEDRRSSTRGACVRIKQIISHLTAGNLVEHDRLDWLREREEQRMLDRLSMIAAG